MTTPAEQAQSDARAARRRAERQSTEGVGVDPLPTPPVEHYLEQHEAIEGAALAAAEELERQEQEEHEKRVRAAEKAAATRKQNEKADADQKGSK